MNSHILKILGESELPEGLQRDHEYLISINAEITKVSEKSDQEGGTIYSYSAKQRTVEVLKDNGEILKAKDRSSNSRKLKGQLLVIAQERGENPEEYYNQQMIKIRHWLPEILDFINKLK